MVHYIPPDFRTRDIYSMIYRTQKKRSKIGQMNHTLEMACKRPLIIKGIKTIRLGVWLVWVFEVIWGESSLNSVRNWVNAPYANCTEYQTYCKYLYSFVMFALDSVSNGSQDHMMRGNSCCSDKRPLILSSLRSWQS